MTTVEPRSGAPPTWRCGWSNRAKDLVRRVIRGVAFLAALRELRVSDPQAPTQLSSVNTGRVAPCAHGAHPVRTGRDADPVQDPHLRAGRGSALPDRPGDSARGVQDDRRGRDGPAGRAGPGCRRRTGGLAGRTALAAGRPRPAVALRRHRAGSHLDAGRRHRRAAPGAGPEQHARIDIRRGPEAVLADALDTTRKLLAAEGIERLAGVGIGVPGPVDFQKGVPVSPPIMPGWDGYPVRDALSRELGTPVLLDNDVNVMALGEQHTGVARSASDFLFVKIGTGIGCGIVVGRSPLPRRRRLRGGHRPHPPRPDRAGLCLRQPGLPRGLLRRRRARPRRDHGCAGGQLGRRSPSCSSRTARSPPRASVVPWAAAMPRRSSSRATAVVGSAPCWPTWSRSSTRG